jgi:hypothetical protein
LFFPQAMMELFLVRIFAIAMLALSVTPAGACLAAEPLLDKRELFTAGEAGYKPLSHSGTRR